MSALHTRTPISFLRASSPLPRHTAMQFSPWLLVGSALILGLAIAFWAIKNSRLERDSMQRNLQERAGALMWAMEGGARAGMGMPGLVAYIQFMLEEIAKQKDIVYIALITPEGEVMAHSDPSRVGGRLYDPDALEGVGPYSFVTWRIMHTGEGRRIFEAYRRFAPLPGFFKHRGAGRHGARSSKHGMGNMGVMMRGRARANRPEQPLPDTPPPSTPLSPSNPGIALPREAFSQPAKPAPENAKNLIIIVGLDLSPFEQALTVGERNIFFTAVLVGLLGFGGIISLFWAQSYKMSRRLLLDTRAFADEVITSLPLGLIIMDAPGAVTFINEVAERLLGCSNTDIAGCKPEDFQGEEWAAIARRTRAGEPVLEEEHTLRLPALMPLTERGAGLSIPVSISASRIMNEEGQNLGSIYLLRDLREMKRLREELRRSERLSALGNMAARVAHEIRNPLSSIKGFATYLGSRHHNKEDKEAAAIMIGEVERLNRVVSELLDFARPSNLRIAPVDPYDLAQRAVALVEADRKNKGIAILLPKRPEDEPPFCLGVDAERVIQALLNLLLNAVQATEPGGRVSLRIQAPDSPDSAPPVVQPSQSPSPYEPRYPDVFFARLIVSDTGAGMSPEVRDQVFSPFFTTRAKGSGLGLTIVARIVEDHHGKVTVESLPNQGTTVTMWLPLASDASGSQSADSGAPAPPLQGEPHAA